MPDFEQLARVAYQHAEANYSRKGARFDVIVECYEIAEIAEDLAAANVSDEAGAKRWADGVASAQHEQELNQAWDGPESVKSSELYDPAHDPAGPPEDLDSNQPDDDGPSLEERFEHYAFEERMGWPYGSSF
jgi:hypothetical protein